MPIFEYLCDDCGTKFEKLVRNRDTHPLFDTDRFRRQIEAAYLQMWEIWQRGEPPQSLSIAPEIP